MPELGDLVLFYETAGKRDNGAKGLVCASRVTAERPEQRSPPKGKWVYQIACAEPPERAVNYVGPAEMLRLIDSSAPLHTWRGLRRIEAEQYNRLRTAMGLPPMNPAQTV